MPKALTIPVACLLLVSYCFAQQNDTILNPGKSPNKWMIKFAPFSIVESDGGVNISVEYLFARQRIGFQMEAQPVLFSIQNDWGASGLSKPRDVLQSGPVHGIKLRPEIRYYFDGLKVSNHFNSSQYRSGQEVGRRLPIRTYLAVAFLYKQTRQQRINEFYIYNGGTQQGFLQQAEYSDVKRVTQFECKFGVLRPLIGEHLLADVYFGLGIRVRKLFYRNLPPGALGPDRGGSLIGGSGTQSETIPAFPFGVKIVYLL